MLNEVSSHERRVSIAHALRRLIAAKGIASPTLRAVAAEAGVSMGLVQHYFSSKDELMNFTFELTEQQTEESINRRLAAEEGADTRRQIEILLEELLPLDEDRRESALMFLLVSLQHSAVADRVRAGLDQMTVAVREWLQVIGVPAAERDEIANELVALHEGLAVLLLGRFIDAERGLQIQHAHLDRLFVGMRNGPAVV